MDAVEEIRGRLNIEDVVGEYVALKRAGRNYKGLSPFGNEKTPSFIVSPEKQIWHDFSSGKGGDMFSFVMEMEGLDFKAALELLARRAGIDLDQFKGRSGGNAELKERLRKALALAAKFYQVQFSRHKIALDYVLHQRKFTKETALTFLLGYAPNNGTALYDFMKKQEFTDDELKKAGLITRRYNGVGDMFRGRLMIPLQDSMGSVIGFTARQLEDTPSAPKYINTPATLLYDKSRHVYGLHLAKDQIRRTGFAVLVEGNLDVIASHQAKVSNVVATAGTALTEAHLKAISRFAGDIRLSFDADKAGVAATERAIPIASKVGVSLHIVTLPEGKDPDELIKNKPGAWEKAIEKPYYAVDWLIDRYKHQYDITSGQGKRQFSDKMLPTIRALKDPVEQDHYLHEIADLTGVSVEALNTKFKADDNTKPLRKRNMADQVQNSRMQLEWAKTQDHLLALALMRPDLRDQL
ncbi:MAG TPA: DNA primase, partial [Candidatus Limnocylindrales bacterium]|nr:DNA primase [Candidatus Limnocylindrales bacterium]